MRCASCCASNPTNTRHNLPSPPPSRQNGSVKRNAVLGRPKHSRNLFCIPKKPKKTFNRNHLTVESLLDECLLAGLDIDKALHLPVAVDRGDVQGGARRSHVAAFLQQLDDQGLLLPIRHLDTPHCRILLRIGQPRVLLGVGVHLVLVVVVAHPVPVLEKVLRDVVVVKKVWTPPPLVHRLLHELSRSIVVQLLVLVILVPPALPLPAVDLG